MRFTGNGLLDDVSHFKGCVARRLEAHVDISESEVETKSDLRYVDVTRCSGHPHRTFSAAQSTIRDA